MNEDIINFINFEHLRKNKNVTQKELSQITGINEKSYNHIENKNRPLSIKHAIILAEYFNISLDDIFLRTIKNDKISNYEKELLNKIKSLNQKDKNTIINLINSLSEKE
jgi:DNA-binding XRE family transcriptional regulator